MTSTLVSRASLDPLAHRAHIASTVSSLRDLTPRVPFWELGAHRIPTLWTLYRGLLRNAPSDIIRTTIRWEFDRHRHLTSPIATRDHLRRLHRWLGIFKQARQGDQRLQNITNRYTRMLEAKRDKDILEDMVRKELVWQERLRTRPRLTGAIMNATLYNKPLPRLKPQPINITGILASRHRKRIMRQAQLESLNELRLDLQRECEFEANLEKRGLKFTKVISEDSKEMSYHLQSRLNTINDSFARDMRRLLTPRSPQLMETVRNARRFKVENKTRERLREESGEVLPITVRRARKRPPPHILTTMSEQQKRWDAIARSSVSEVGYVGYVKRKLGWKLRKPDAWKVEAGMPENLEALKKMDAFIREENERRRAASEQKGGLEARGSKDVD